MFAMSCIRHLNLIPNDVIRWFSEKTTYFIPEWACYKMIDMGAFHKELTAAAMKKAITQRDRAVELGEAGGGGGKAKSKEAAVPAEEEEREEEEEEREEEGQEGAARDAPREGTVKRLDSESADFGKLVLEQLGKKKLPDGVTVYVEQHYDPKIHKRPYKFYYVDIRGNVLKFGTKPKGIAGALVHVAEFEKNKKKVVAAAPPVDKDKKKPAQAAAAPPPVDKDKKQATMIGEKFNILKATEEYENAVVKALKAVNATLPSTGKVWIERYLSEGHARPYNYYFYSPARGAESQKYFTKPKAIRAIVESIAGSGSGSGAAAAAATEKKGKKKKAVVEKEKEANEDTDSDLDQLLYEDAEERKSLSPLLEEEQDEDDDEENQRSARKKIDEFVKTFSSGLNESPEPVEEEPVREEEEEEEEEPEGEPVPVEEEEEEEEEGGPSQKTPQAAKVRFSLGDLHKKRQAEEEAKSGGAKKKVKKTPLAVKGGGKDAAAAATTAKKGKEEEEEGEEEGEDEDVKMRESLIKTLMDKSNPGSAELLKLLRRSMEGGK